MLSLQKPNAPVAEAAARPKVLRRPAQFSRPSPLPAASAPLPPLGEPVATPAAAVPLSRLPMVIAKKPLPWQEDGQFGMRLIVLLVIVNMALAWLLPPLAKPIAPTESGTAISHSATMPAAVASPAPAVTVYSDDMRAEDNPFAF